MTTTTKAPVPVYVTAEKLRTRYSGRRTTQGIVADYSNPRTDIRGTPVGERAQVWEWERLVYPGRRQTGRRVREYIKVMHCPEGWYSTSGTADDAGPALCSTLLEPQWNGDGFPGNFNRYHVEHPVLWVIKVRRNSTVTTYRYCDAEMPGEYRPDPDAEPCHDCRHLIPLGATAYALDSAVTCEPCGVLRYGDRAPEYRIA